MKLTSILILAATLHVAAAGHAQRVTLSVKNAPLKTVFIELNKQTGYNFLYTDEALAAAKKVSITVKNASLTDVLALCFKDQPLDYTIENNAIVISKRNDKKDNGAVSLSGVEDNGLPIDIKGRVVDENGKPVIASVQVKGTNKGTTTNDNGEFELKGVDDNATLVISGVSIESFEVKVNGRSELALNARVKTIQGEEVQIVSTGYQQIPKERATGSFSQLNTQQIQRNTDLNIINRLNGMVPGLYITPNSSNLLQSVPFFNPTERRLGILIRGQSTISSDVSADPLIILDNFPFEGDLNNINPNDIASITFLKDAAAASIWGARSANGVIVITTKKGSKNQRLRTDFSVNTSWIQKPDLKYDRNYLPSDAYVEVEKYLFDQGFFDGDLTNTYNFPVISPAVLIMDQLRQGTISAADAEGKLNELRQRDIRNDISKYIYQVGKTQQYSLSLRGGTQNAAYSFSAGYDHNSDVLKRNGFERITLNNYTNLSPSDKLDITFGINYSRNKTMQNNQFAWGTFNHGIPYTRIIPYSQLADKTGAAMAIPYNYNPSFIDSVQKLGFYDWSLKPVDEIDNGDRYTNSNMLIVKAAIKYQITSALNLQLNYQNELENLRFWDNKSLSSFYTRDLINQFSIYDPATGKFTYQIPVGGILDISTSQWVTNNGRAQLNFDKIVNQKHAVNAIAGAEIRQINTTTIFKRTYGYNDQYGTGASNLNYSDYLMTNPNNYLQIPYPNNNVNRYLTRFVSGFINASYSYQSRYTFSLSGRNDGSNIFGVRTNDKITPLWSVGFSWDALRENLFDISWINNLKFRTTYGFLGNVYNGSAYVTGTTSITPLTNMPSIVGIQPGNPELRWERVRNFNIGMDFSLLNNVLSGTVEYYHKTGMDLIQQQSLAPSTGFVEFTTNSAETRTHGIDLLLHSNLKFGPTVWSSILIVNTLKDRLTKFDHKPTEGSIQNEIPGYVDKPLYSIFSYKWAGLDPSTGDPEGIYHGSVSKDYASIINNYSLDSLVYNGPARPTLFGSWRNEINIKGFTISANLLYQFGSYFRRPSVSLNYTDILGGKANVDYLNRWQRPGDERSTNVPSLVYPSDLNRNTFYTYSQVLVEKADFIKIQDVRLGYSVDKTISKKLPFTRFEIYTYLNNIGMLWRANKYGIDPGLYSNITTDFTSGSLPAPLSFSFGINLSL